MGNGVVVALIAIILILLGIVLGIVAIDPAFFRDLIPFVVKK